jgi:hypothetical protein
MENPLPMKQASTFISKNTPQLLDRFDLTYRHEFSCVDYYINDIETGCRISKEILFTLDRFENRIVVSRFYPELSQMTNSKFLSATSFYLMIHHFINILQVPSCFQIYLNSKPAIFINFYEKLKDFNFFVQGSKKEKYWNVLSSVDFKNVDTSMFSQSLDGL